MSDYSLTPYMPDDILIEKHNGCDPSESVWLREALDQLMEFTETVMCEANAKEVYDVACILETMASDLRCWYSKHKHFNFEKIEARQG